MYIKKVFIFLLVIVMVFGIIGCTVNQSEEAIDKDIGKATTRTIEDMAGRTVTIPTNVNKVYSTNSIGTIFLYTLAPDKIAGWNNELGSDKQYIKEEYHNLPVLGRWKGPNSLSIEEILKVQPDIIINMGDVNEKYIAESDEIQELFGIPVIMVDGSLTMQDEAYQFLGDILGVESRALELADYSKNIIEDIEVKAGLISDEEKTQVYYAAGIKGIETVPTGSINTEVLDFVGGQNIASLGSSKDVRRMEVSLEQIIGWNPELIIISPDSSDNHEAYNSILKDKAWSNIAAVQNKEVYEIPYGPYDWFNRPPSVMRLMGLQWLGNLLYPDIYQIDLETETKNFFDLFFDHQLSDNDVKQILERSVR